MSTDEQFRKMLGGYSLTTAEILYHLPDHRSLLQIYIWQEYDLFPEFPNLWKFLKFWHTRLDGPLHSVRVAHEQLITRREIRVIEKEFHIH
ncbi:aspartate-semialdehyde dehydrogenase [Candidatus Kaiserbacteria bacterium RIFCSPHIGHO2_01_FULL_46_22]|uniref:Aspartate-semialdehyde dehydrogenase n=1 Tax=Candidatus Kaiserbacteria bacterium RIFCSPHIGHO2_01_FULL_46_22 TaxID=1798475 RepID=A0A1F6BYW6_9BACT|nr:MAG: aspartate-semialdehyde dehydrogenase [Candidatus Kaiserbacteria bacterium RIFCSPHIGHO2_01_FULL_46_22]